MAVTAPNKPKADTFRLVNTTGAILADGQFTVIGERPLRCIGGAAVGAVAAFEDISNQIHNVSEFDTGKGTFATANLPVYWIPASGLFSNTATTGNFLVGYISVVPDAQGVAEVLFCRAKSV